MSSPAIRAATVVVDGVSVVAFMVFTIAFSKNELCVGNESSCDERLLDAGGRNHEEIKLHTHGSLSGSNVKNG